MFGEMYNHFGNFFNVIFLMQYKSQHLDKVSGSNFECVIWTYIISLVHAMNFYVKKIEATSSLN